MNAPITYFGVAAAAQQASLLPASLMRASASSNFWLRPPPQQVALSPQRPRTVLAFDNRVFTTDSSGARPVLTLFEHVEGSRVGEGLFTEYTLPNGKKAFMYCDGGSAMDEAEIGPVQPPPRPTTVPLALQQSMPLAEVLDFIAQPPGRCELRLL